MKKINLPIILDFKIKYYPYLNGYDVTIYKKTIIKNYNKLNIIYNGIKIYNFKLKHTVMMDLFFNESFVYTNKKTLKNLINNL